MIKPYTVSQDDRKMSDKKFHHYVKDKDGHIEMELWHVGNGKWMVHYPRYKNQLTHLRTNTCFSEFYTYQVAMLIFAYNKEEFERFDKEFEMFMRNEQK